MIMHEASKGFSCRTILQAHISMIFLDYVARKFVRKVCNRILKALAMADFEEDDLQIKVAR